MGVGRGAMHRAPTSTYPSFAASRFNLSVFLRLSVPSCIILFLLVLTIASASAQTPSSSLRFTQNARAQHDYGLQTTLPTNFGMGEFTVELWIRPDNSYPIGNTGQDTPGQLVNWADVDYAPYSRHDWWYIGNFLLDGHNNNSPADGTFSLQFYGGGRLRWLFGDGACNCPGGHWGVGAYPAANTPSLLDGNWHQVTLVRRWRQPTGAALELWIDGVLIDSENTPARTNMWTTYWQNWTGFPTEQPGWFWGSEKQAAVPIYIQQYEDYKGLIDELRLWSRAKSASEITSGWRNSVTGSEMGIVGYYPFSEGTGTATCDALNPTQCMTLLRMLPGYWSPQNAPLQATSATLNGTITMQGRSAANVLLRVSVGAAQYTPTPNMSGVFSIPNLAPDTTSIRVKHAQSLAVVQNVTLTAGANAVIFPLMRMGDVNDDNAVTLPDFSLLASSFNRSTGQGGYDARADLNGDGSVTLQDFSLLASNFNQVGS